MRPYTLLDQDGFPADGKQGTAHYERLEGTNIVAMLPGESTDQAIVAIAHHDTVRDSPGANDNTASVVCLLEMARALAGERLRPTLIFVTPDMEEIGLLGS